MQIARHYRNGYCVRTRIWINSRWYLDDDMVDGWCVNDLDWKVMVSGNIREKKDLNAFEFNIDSIVSLKYELNKNFWMHVFIWVGIYERRQRALKWNRSLTQFPFLLENCFTRLSVEMKHENHNNVRVPFNLGYFIWIS